MTKKILLQLIDTIMITAWQCDPHKKLDKNIFVTSHNDKTKSDQAHYDSTQILSK